MDSNRRAKILYTTTDTSPQSGAFRSLLSMSREIQKWGYDSLLLLPQEGGGRQIGIVTGEIADYRLPLPQAKRGKPFRYYMQYVLQNSRSVVALARLLRQEQTAIVHANEILDLYAAVAARLAGVPCVWHIRSDLSSMPMLQRVLPRMVVALSSAVIAVSHSVDQHMFKHQGIHSDKVMVLYNPGPNLSVFHPGVDGSRVRMEFGISAEAHLIVLVAKLGERKGHDIAIRAAPQVWASYPNTRFLLVGGELEGEHHRQYAAKLRELTRELGAEEKVIFTGYRADVPQIMAAADIVLHCSTYPDPLPGVVLQGMAVGRPVIAPNLGGPREQIEDQLSGVLVEPRSPAALAAAICALLADEPKRIRLGRAAADRVQAMFAQDLFYERLTDVYAKLISRSQDRIGQPKIGRAATQ